MTEKNDQSSTIPTYKILAFFLILGVGFYVWFSSAATPDSFMINSFEFTEVACPSVSDACYQTFVETNIGVREITFYSDPREVRDITVDSQAVLAILNLTTSRNSSLTIAFDEGVPGEVGVASTLIARVTGERLYNISTSGAVYGQQVTCADSQGLNRVIYLVQGSREGAYLENGCILLIAEDASRLREVVDAYTMHLLLILP